MMTWMTFGTLPAPRHRLESQISSFAQQQGVLDEGVLAGGGVTLYLRSPKQGGYRDFGFLSMALSYGSADNGAHLGLVGFVEAVMGTWDCGHCNGLFRWGRVVMSSSGFPMDQLRQTRVPGMNVLIFLPDSWYVGW